MSHFQFCIHNDHHSSNGTGEKITHYRHIFLMKTSQYLKRQAAHPKNGAAGNNRFEDIKDSRDGSENPQFTEGMQIFTEEAYS